MAVVFIKANGERAKVAPLSPSFSLPQQLCFKGHSSDTMRPRGGREGILCLPFRGREVGRSTPVLRAHVNRSGAASLFAPIAISITWRRLNVTPLPPTFDFDRPLFIVSRRRRRIPLCPYLCVDHPWAVSHPLYLCSPAAAAAAGPVRNSGSHRPLIYRGSVGSDVIVADKTDSFNGETSDW